MHLTRKLPVWVGIESRQRRANGCNRELLPLASVLHLKEAWRRRPGAQRGGDA